MLLKNVLETLVNTNYMGNLVILMEEQVVYDDVFDNLGDYLERYLSHYEKTDLRKGIEEYEVAWMESDGGAIILRTQPLYKEWRGFEAVGTAEEMDKLSTALGLKGIKQEDLELIFKCLKPKETRLKNKMVKVALLDGVDDAAEKEGCYHTVVEAELLSESDCYGEKTVVRLIEGTGHASNTYDYTIFQVEAI